jgi:two-component system chemotaxis response regulator CheY
MGIGVGTDALSYRAVGDVASRLSLKQRDLEDMMAELHQRLQGAKELVSIGPEQKESGRGYTEETMAFNLLIVDDSNSMRTVVRKIVGLTGLEVNQILEADNGRKALDILGGNWVDAVILDINMPEMNGLELLKQMSEDSVMKNIPVVMMTTEASEAHMKTAFELGAKGFIRKPFVPEELRKMLLGVLGFDEKGSYGEHQGDSEGVDF